MNKMDEFFKKQLTNHQEADDGWNIPSEDLWNKAQPHFPKPKKKIRLIFFLLPLILICGIGSYAILSDSTNQLETTTTENDLLLTSNTTDTPSTQTKELDNNKAIEQVPTEALAKETQTTANKNLELTPTSKRNQVTRQEKSALGIKKTPSKQSNQSTNVAATPSTNKWSAPPPSQPKVVIAQDEEKNNEPIKHQSLNAINQLAQLRSFVKSSNSSTAINENFESQLGLANIETKTSIISKHEIGLGSTLHLLTMLGEVKSAPNEEWPLEEIYFNSEKNSNLNIHYNQILSPKWSLSTGLYLNNMNLNIYGLTFYEFTQADIDGQVLTNLDNRIDGNFTSFRQSDAYKIELIPGESIQPGETIGIDLDVSVNYKSALLPVLINRSWRMKSSEFFIGIGGSANLQSWKQQSADIELYRGNTLITKPYSEGELPPENILSLGFVFQTGINYNITQRLKLGIAGRIFLPEFMPTGLEARLLYSL